MGERCDRGGGFAEGERTPDTTCSEDPGAQETFHLAEGIDINASDRYGHVHDRLI